jgi:hypothetical protein
VTERCSGWPCRRKSSHGHLSSFRQACERLGIAQSMGRQGSALDNAVTGSWHPTLEFELRSQRKFATRAQARSAIAAWIEDYSHVRRHSAIGMRSPVDCERSLAGKDAAYPRRGPGKGGGCAGAPSAGSAVPSAPPAPAPRPGPAADPERRIRPLPSDQPPVPGQQGSRAHDPMHPQATGAVSPVRPRARDLPPQDRDLMPQDQDLRVLRGVTARQQRQPAEHPDHEQVDKADEHERRA